MSFHFSVGHGVIGQRSCSQGIWWRRLGALALGAGALGSIGCSAEGSARLTELDGTPQVTAEQLASRAYVISEHSDDLFVVDLSTMTEVATVETGVGEQVNSNHMSMLSQDGSKLYISATEQNAIVVVDTRSLEVVRRIELGLRPTHTEACFDCAPYGRDELWVVNEDGGGPAMEAGDEDSSGQGSVSIIDMASDEVVRTIADDSFNVPHFARFSAGKAFIPNIAGNQISVIDLATYRVSDLLLLEGETEPGPCAGDPCGFADAQIDSNGLLVAAHIETGHVVSFDTQTAQRRPDLLTGSRPWAVYVDLMSDSALNEVARNNQLDTHLMPNWGDETVSLLDRREPRELARSLEGDQISYGVNFSPLAPGQAFVLNSVKERVAVIDRTSGELIEALDVGGTTETASTTSDGRHLLLPLSSTNQFAVLDMTTRKEVARFDNVGVYPWSVTTMGGQNYCH